MRATISAPVYEAGEERASMDRATSAGEAGAAMAMPAARSSVKTFKIMMTTLSLLRCMS